MAKINDEFLDKVLNQEYSDIKKSKAFELFSIGLVMQKKLKIPQIKNGIISETEVEQAIDGCYVISNGVNLCDCDMKTILELNDKVIDIYLCQSKLSKMPMVAYCKIVSLLRKWFKSEFKEDAELNSRDKKIFKIMRNLLNNRIGANVKFNIHIYMLSGIEVLFDSKPFSDKHSEIKEEIESFLEIFNATVFIKGYNLDGLLKLHNSPNVEEKEINYKNVTSYHTAREIKYYLLTVDVKDYHNFLSRNSMIDDRLFEWNIRGFLGAGKNVSKDIKNSLVSGKELFFLNNGVTIIADEIKHVNSKVSLKNPQIVNGQQTSYVLYNHFLNEDLFDKFNQTIFVKLIETSDEKLRDDIIIGTNSQNSVAESQTYANDNLQRIVEQILAENGYFYQRRKTQVFKGKNRHKIYDIVLLCQVIGSIVYRKHADARRRPSNFVINDYEKIFNKNKDSEFYINSIVIYENCLSEMLKNDILKNEYNFIWMVCSIFSRVYFGDCNVVKEISAVNIDEAFLSNIKCVVDKFAKEVSKGKSESELEEYASECNIESWNISPKSVMERGHK